MYVAHLSLTDFRSYAQVELPLEPGITALVGPNGQGKTNLVEAMGYVATLGSHRVADGRGARARGDLPRGGPGQGRPRAGAGQPRSTLVEIEVTPGKANRARVNGGSPTRARDVLGILRTVLFAPEDLSLVKGDPDGRRRFLDDLLVQLTPRVAGTVADYDRVLRQRSALLKSAAVARRGAGADLRTLDVWDAKLAQTGAQIIVARRAWSGRWRRTSRRHMRRSAPGRATRSSTYKASLDAVLEIDDDAAGVELVEAQLLEAMGRLRSKEIERGVSLVGPHRDDLVLTLGGLPAKGYASHGESWSFALALRLASYELLTRGDEGSAATGVRTASRC